MPGTVSRRAGGAAIEHRHSSEAEAPPRWNLQYTADTVTTLGRTIVAAGELTSEEDVTIHGRVSGQIVVRDATLVVAETARVDADVRAARIVIRGELNGTVVAGERIVLDATASVTGSLSADRVVIADGARFDGRIDMDRRTIAMKVAQYKDQRAHAT